MAADSRTRNERERARRQAEGFSARKWPQMQGLAPVPDLSEGHCRGAGDLFYPEGAGRQDIVDAALRVCRGCPLQQPCLDYATAAKERHGIWGGRDFDRTAQRDAAHIARAAASRPPPISVAITAADQTDQEEP